MRTPNFRCQYWKGYGMIRILSAACLLIGTATAGLCEPTGFGTRSVPSLPINAGASQVIKVVQGEQSFQAYLTGYSFWDNTPPGSAAIARPVIHRRAGGSGTYGDPITIAVGYRLVNASARLEANESCAEGRVRHQSAARAELRIRAARASPGPRSGGRSVRGSARASR